MTREEAISILKNPSEMYQGTDGIVGYTFNPNKRNYEAFQLAIEALEKEPCEDCVRRRTSIPKVAPTHKGGKWIKYSVERAGEQHYQCTNCKNYVNFGVWGDYYTKDFKYCPHCGVRMEEKE